MRQFLKDMADGAAVTFGVVLAAAAAFAPVLVIMFYCVSKFSPAVAILAGVSGSLIYFMGAAYAFAMLCERKGWSLGHGLRPPPLPPINHAPLPYWKHDYDGDA